MCNFENSIKRNNLKVYIKITHLKHRLLYIPIFFLFLLSFVDCAKKGTPSGGLKDSLAPVIIRSNPENYTTNFKGDEIRITFDEYIKLKDIQKELIISPPLKYAPIITPLSTSKTLRIKILDTLKENTTYSFNFGNSIVDNNEDNPFPYFKYVISTGSYIDSLKLTGKVFDAQLLNAELPTTVLLYEANEAFKDSLIYKEKPTYITVTTDSSGTYELTNIKAGKYLLLALKEKTNDYIFQPRTDKIGFVDDYITLPTDSTYNITVFKEQQQYKANKPKQESKNHILFGFEGVADSLQIKVITEIPDDFEATTYRDLKKDTLHYYFRPDIEKDSIIFQVKNKSRIDTLTLRLRNLSKDSLSLISLAGNTLKLKDTFKLLANTPLRKIDNEKIKINDKDTLNIDFTTRIDSTYNLAEIIFAKKEEQRYTLNFLPDAIIDFFGNKNDTIRTTLNTKLESDYGTLTLNLNNVKQFPIIVQLLNEKLTVVDEQYLTENRAIFFDEISPARYYFRIIYDENENKKWDSGDFLSRRKPEKIVFYPRKIEVRANWSPIETFTLE